MQVLFGTGSNDRHLYLEEWIAASGVGSEPKAPLFPTLRHGRLTDRTPLCPRPMCT